MQCDVLRKFVEVAVYSIQEKLKEELLSLLCLYSKWTFLMVIV